MKHTLLIVMVGFLMFVVGLFMDAYKDPQSFHDTVLKLSEEGPTRESTLKYHQLRDEQLTYAYKVQDYGLTLIVIAFLVSIFVKARHESRVLTSRGRVLLLGNLLAFVIVGAFIGDLATTVIRGEVPPWADSIGLPLIGLPVIFIGAMFYVNFFTLITGSHFVAPFPLAAALGRGHGWLSLRALLLRLAVVLTTGIAIFFGVYGLFWYFGAFSLLAVYVLSVLAGHNHSAYNNTFNRTSSTLRAPSTG